MKRRGLILLGALAALTFGLALAGCSTNRLTLDDLTEMGYTRSVTFDWAGGRLGDSETPLVLAL